MPEEVAAAGGPEARPVELVIPASSAYLALVRATTHATCARLDFTIDQLEDVTLAIDEAVSLLISDAVAGTDIQCSWMGTESELTVSITSVSTAGRPPRTTTFAWTVLSSLVDRAEASFSAGRVTLTLRVVRRHSGAVN